MPTERLSRLKPLDSLLTLMPKQVQQLRMVLLFICRQVCSILEDEDGNRLTRDGEGEESLDAFLIKLMVS